MSHVSAVRPAAAATPAAIYRKISWRIVPLLFISYVVAFLDRINIGFAQLQMKQDLGFTDAIYGLGAGIFFIGYVIFEVPSNLLLARIGARRTFSRIMLCWGVVSAGMMFVSAPWQFYLMRFLLGAFEAGFFPGIVLYLTLWYPAERRATVVSWFFAGVAFAGLIGGLLSGWIMKDMAGVAGLAGWQWMFFIEGTPAALLGLVCYFALVDSPDEVDWLSDDEKRFVTETLAAERATLPAAAPHSFGAALRKPLVYVFSFVYFALAAGSFAISFWVPTLIKELGVTDVLSVGLYSAIPYGIGAIGIITIARRSDRLMERRWHFAFCAFGAGLALAALTLHFSNIALMIAILSIAVVCVYAAMPVFWAIPPAHLSGAAAAGGIAFISSVGQIGGFASPYAIGLIKTHFGNLDHGWHLMSLLLCLGGVAMTLALSPGNGKRA
ncbi:Putative tartrate transporter [Paraburkholderia unamae]|uniref:MFS transporter n=1 Tax=Paraburkholderia unamae TaxID=219649 RepID=UPI001CB28376|nr:MFS transporter [Paraburkholderia unamae]CAG9266658.1 Putative tartrate transporter [Paraburkholderia unamae]